MCAAMETSDSSAPDDTRRFGGIARLYGEAGRARLADARVCVVGIGGVGSWAVEGWRAAASASSP
jgi:tRNA A37 threonylcarbamoyladenosine dehydratase